VPARGNLSEIAKTGVSILRIEAGIFQVGLAPLKKPPLSLWPHGLLGDGRPEAPTVHHPDTVY
jgi:hypothetical protein